MYDRIIVRSKLKDYYLDFIEDFSKPVKANASIGAFFIVDSKVYELYKEQIISVLPEDQVVLVEANEFNKTIDKCKEIIETLIKKNIRRNHALIAIGGGIIQDITAFISSILYRGIDWSFIPTTLIAQADSCIGSKTSINFGDKKNLIGNFYPPSHIYIDVNFLNTLTVNDIKSGIGEILHFNFYANSPATELLINNYDELIKNPKLFIEYINTSLAIKKSVIEFDEFDKDERNKFNYGHTFGHAIETVTSYRINHGQAITIGMDIANYISQKLGYMDMETFMCMHRILEKNMPELNMEEYDLKEYFFALSKDKKNIGESLGCILAKRPGALIKKQIPFDDRLKKIITDYFKSYRKN